MSYFLKGKGGGRPQHLRLERPADADGHASLRAFLEEHAFWEIDEPLRRLVYCFINGVVTAELRPALADGILRALAPDFPVLFRCLDIVEEQYSSGFNPAARDLQTENTRAFREAHRRAFSRVLVKAGELGANPDIDAWCALQYCAGVVARQRGLLGAAHLVRRLQREHDHAERHLFTWVTGHAEGWDWFNWGDPLVRFFAACYPATMLERAIIPALLGRCSEDLVPDKAKCTLRGLFEESLRVGLRTAQNDAGMLTALLEDIERGIGPGCVAENGRTFREEMGLLAVDDQPLDAVWQAARKNIASRYPHLDPVNSHRARRIHLIAYTQCIVDTAFWAGLYLGCPAAFDDYPAWKAAPPA